MKPVRLEMQAFGPYVQMQTLDFTALEEASLVLIVGKTGAGKTTLFDAMSYALFGKVPGARQSREGLLTSNHPDAKGMEPKVSFTFDVGDKRYRAERSPPHTRKKKRATKGGDDETAVPPSAHLYEVTADGDRLLASKGGEVSDRVTALVGFNEVQFNQVLVLPQGQFQRFLTAKSDEKEALLIQLFGVDVMDRAQDMLAEAAKVAKDKVDAVVKERELLLGMAAASSSEDLAASLAAATASLPGEQQAAKDAAARLSEAAKVRELLGVARRTVSAFARATAKGEEGAAKVASVTVTQEAAAKALASLEPLRAKLEALRVTRGAMDKVVALEAKVRARDGELSDEAARLAKDAATVVKLDAEFQSAVGELAHLKRLVESNYAAVLSAALVKGEACPVCGAVDHPAPAHARDKDAAADGGDARALKAQEAALETKRSALDARKRALDTAAAGLAARQEALTASRAELAAALGDAGSAAARARALDEEIDAGARSLAAAEKRKTDADLALASATAARDEALSAAESQKGQLATDWSAAEGMLVALGLDAAVIKRELWAAAKAGNDSMPAAFTAWDADTRAKEDAARKALAATTHRIDTLSKYVASVRENEARHTVAAERARVVVGLASVVRGTNERRLTISRYVLQEYMHRVTDAASERLRKMSRHRYVLRVAENRAKGVHNAGLELVVEDAHAGGAERPVETLSGGEMFLASLSLAMGLADVVQAHAGGVRMEALFIDEGFGTLDDETLDLAVRTLLDLRVEGRMVGIISHLEVLRSLIPTRVYVTPGSGGSTVTLSARAG